MEVRPVPLLSHDSSSTAKPPPSDAPGRSPPQLHAVRDASGERLCGMVNSDVVAGVLPAAQFCNGQSLQVLQLPRLHNVTPFVLHTVWIREQVGAPSPPPRLSGESLASPKLTGPSPRLDLGPHLALTSALTSP